MPAAYLRDLRAFVFNHMHEHVTSEDTEEFWISDATSDEKVTDAALADFKTKKFGANAVAEDLQPRRQRGGADGWPHRDSEARPDQGPAG